MSFYQPTLFLFVLLFLFSFFLALQKEQIEKKEAEKVRLEKKAKKEAERQAIIDEAKRTGIKQLIGKKIIDMDALSDDGDEEELGYKIIETYIDGNGNITEESYYTY